MNLKPIIIKEQHTSSVLYMPIATPGPLKLNTSISFFSLPSLGVKVNENFPGVLTTTS